VAHRGTRALSQARAPRQALRHSAYWACLRLRADLMSTMPVDVYRRVGGVQVEVPTPPVLQSPGGSSCDLIEEWMYSTQFDLDSMFGNTFGSSRRATARASVDHRAAADHRRHRAAARGVTQYRIGATLVDPNSIWHEKQFTVAGVPVGLSPTAYAASEPAATSRRSSSRGLVRRRRDAGGAS
jgi:hypothetical protein